MCILRGYFFSLRPCRARPRLHQKILFPRLTTRSQSVLCDLCGQFLRGPSEECHKGITQDIMIVTTIIFFFYKLFKEHKGTHNGKHEYST